MNPKKLLIIVAIVILALLLGYCGSQFLGPTQRTDLPDTEIDGDFEVDDDTGDSQALPAGRDLTGDEGETVNGVRILGPNEPTRVEERDYFEGLEDMEGAQPIGGDQPPAGTSAPSEMDRMLERAQRRGETTAGGQRSSGAGSAPATGSPEIGPGTGGTNRPPVERPDSELSDILDSMEKGN